MGSVSCLEAESLIARFKHLGGIRSGSELDTDTENSIVNLMSKHDALNMGM